MTGKDVKAAAPKFEVAISFKKEDVGVPADSTRLDC